MSDIVMDLVSNAPAFGCAWTERELSKGRDKKISLGKRPLLEVTDLGKFRATVPDADAKIKASVNGTSFRVAQQNAMRPALVKNATMKNDALKVLCAKRVLGFRAEATVAATVVTVKRADWAATPKAIQDATLASGVSIAFVD